MKRNIIETVLGAVVLVVGGVFLVYSSTVTDAGKVSGYDISVSFNEIGSLKTGDDVRIGGVKIGTVEAIRLDPATYRADVTLSIENDVKIPTDTAARVSSESLMGGNYLALDVGGDEENIRPGGKIQYSQDAQNLESLLGKFIFSMNGKDSGKAAATPASAPAPAKTSPAPAESSAPAQSTITPQPAPQDNSPGAAPLPQM
jgi:phospholipid/cholesterol/gamma-HCH transport system substrate-binding protein